MVIDAGQADLANPEQQEAQYLLDAMALKAVSAEVRPRHSPDGYTSTATTPKHVMRPGKPYRHRWLSEHRTRLARGNDVARAIDYLLKRWAAFTRFLDDGHICISNNAAERAPRGIALGRKSWLLCGSDRGGQHAAVMYSLIVTAKMNGVDPQAWLADVLARIADHPAHRLDDLLPWRWAASQVNAVDQAA